MVAYDKAGICALGSFLRAIAQRKVRCDFKSLRSERSSTVELSPHLYFHAKESDERNEIFVRSHSSLNCYVTKSKVSSLLCLMTLPWKIVRSEVISSHVVTPLSVIARSGVKSATFVALKSLCRSAPSSHAKWCEMNINSICPGRLIPSSN